MIDIAALVERLGPAAIALGAALEGEAVVVTGGALAAAGYMAPVAVALAAFAGSAAADQLLFLAGRRARTTRFVRRVAARPLTVRLLAWIAARPVPFILAFRFVYGCRIAGPIALGVSDVPARSFVALNLIAAAVWAAVFTFIGWRFGPVVEPWLRRIAHHLYGPLGIAALLAIVVAALLLWRQSRQS